MLQKLQEPKGNCFMLFRKSPRKMKMYNREMEAKGKVISSLEAQKEDQVKVNMNHRW